MPLKTVCFCYQKLKSKLPVNTKKRLKMILEEDSLLNFRYNTVNQVLSVTWPDLTNTPLPEIENSLQNLARNIKNFDIRKVLADHRYGFTSLENEAYKQMLIDYHRNLAETNLEKLARLIPENPAWEYYIIQLSQELHDKLNLPFKIRFFKKKTEALKWLRQP